MLEVCIGLEGHGNKLVQNQLIEGGWKV